MCKHENEAETCFNEATKLLSFASNQREPLVLEATILVKGWQVGVTPSLKEGQPLVAYLFSISRPGLGATFSIYQAPFGSATT